MPDPDTEVVELPSDLVGIDSVNPALVAGEARIVEPLRTRPERSLGSAAVIATLPELGVRSDACLIAGPRALLEPDWHAGAEVVADRDGWQLDGSGPAADLAARLGAEIGTGPTFDAPYWMEAPLWQQVCPTLVCGRSGGGLHAVDERVDPSQVRAFTSAVAAVLADGMLRGD